MNVEIDFDPSLKIEIRFTKKKKQNKKWNLDFGVMK